MEDTIIKESSPVNGEPSFKEGNIPPVEEEENNQPPAEGEENPPAEGEENTPNNINKEIQNYIQMELSKLTDQLTNTVEEYKNNSKALEDEKYKLEVEKLLNESKILDGRFFDFVFDEDIEIVKLKIERLEGLIEEEANRLVEIRLRASSWVPGNHSNAPAFKNSNIKTNLSYVKGR